ncbi:MAG TPA: carbohydrate-binding domain-containing protein [Bacteroidales bacterium]|nr:carbohydrate-binding domain-containing protein [Bacteroidales bacterium]
MTKKKRLVLYAVILVLLIIISAVLIIFAAQPKIRSFLTPNKPVAANILVVEGWLSDSSLSVAKNEFIENKYDYLLTTGEPLPAAFELYQNGALNFTIPEKIRTLKQGTHTLIINAWGTRAGNSGPEMRIRIDRKVAGEFSVGLRKKNYRIDFESSQIPHEVTVLFTNNAHIGNEDRNLFVESIWLDGKRFPARSEYTRYVINWNHATKTIETNNLSFAAKAASRLIQMGIDSNKVISLPTPYVNWFRTFTSAVVVTEWMKKHQPAVKGINICSQGNHSRRTWLLYRRAFQDSINIGIITIPEPEYYKEDRLNPKFGVINIWREFTGYLYMKYIFNYKRKYNKINRMLKEKQ